ncbi:MAG: [FeFe] hydrogenase H-cluster maturation GTPase HydF [Candidatus Aminicenantia bacterium]
MAQNSTEKINIGIFGRRNVGKSSLINALTLQEIAIVSPVPGTTRDPVSKTMEIHSLGPCVIWDTAGLDDLTELGDLARDKTRKVMERTDVALVVVDSEHGWGEYEESLVQELKRRNIPFITILNKIDLNGDSNLIKERLRNSVNGFLEVSAIEKIGIDELREKLSLKAKEIRSAGTLLEGIVKEGDLVIFVISIDAETPVGRIKLPQVQAIRECLDSHAYSIVIRDSELQRAMSSLAGKPSLVITDSQLFMKVKDIIPEDIPLTSFSILYARYKGDLRIFVEGLNSLKNLKNGSRVLIAEGCTHHPIEDDVATVKIPKILRKISEDIEIHYTRGRDYPDEVEKYKLIIHCGACMIGRREVLSRIDKAKKENIPITNYGMLFAYDSGVIKRALKPFDIEIKI